jgi:hypothetical protein
MNITVAAAGPYGSGSAADVRRRRPPVGGENAEHLKMAECLICKRPLKVIFKLSAENARTTRKLPFSDLHGHFRGHENMLERWNIASGSLAC